MGWEVVPEEIGRLPVLDAEGASHELRHAWQGRRAVLVFVRHFG